MTVKFEGQDRREATLAKVLPEYGLKSLEEARELCLSKGIDVDIDKIPIDDAETYKLYSEGWAWENSYSPRNSCSTGNNEMSGMVSLYTINSSCTANMYKKNVYPHAIFNLFKKDGYTTSSYHNYTEQYYARKTIHPNMGSDKYYGVQDLGISYSNVYHEWPSDVDLIEKVLEFYEDGKIAYATYSYEYNTFLAKEQYPEINEINTIEEFCAEIINKEEFEKLWSSKVTNNMISNL